MPQYQQATREQVEKFLEDTKTGNTRGRRVKKKRTPLRIAGSVLSTLIVLVLVVFLVSLVKTRIEGGSPSLFGYRIFRVETGSMIPTLPVGAVLLTHVPDDPAALGVGTIITYTHESATITHRITDIVYEEDEQTGEKRLRYQTQGDNPNNSADPWTVAPEQILGEVIWHFAF